VVLHALNAALLFLLLQKLTGATWRSISVAALFAVHPLRVESVAWISELKDVLSSTFGLLALIFYVRYAKVRANVERAGSAPPATAPSFAPGWSYEYLLALCFFALGLMSKPMLVTWPFVMLLFDYWPLRRFEFSTQKQHLQMLSKLFIEKTPFFL